MSDHIVFDFARTNIDRHECVLYTIMGIAFTSNCPQLITQVASETLSQSTVLLGGTSRTSSERFWRRRHTMAAKKEAL